MKRETLVFGCVAALVTVVGLLTLGAEISFSPSTYNPALEEAVTFEVCEPCLGDGVFVYKWDFDGDGAYEISSEDPMATHVFTDPGFVDVGLQVIDAGGRPIVRRKGILVGESPLIAVRDVVNEDGATFIVITFSANWALTAPGLEENVPAGWQLQILDTAGSLEPHMENDTLGVLWADQILEGWSWAFSYRLYPTYATGAPALSGIASGYIGGRRVKATVCGDLSIPR